MGEGTTDLDDQGTAASRARRAAARAGIPRAGQVAHVGFEQDDRPYVIPMLYHYSPEQPRPHLPSRRMSSRMLQHLASGIPVCVTVTQLDGLVYSRDAKYHSANYRCVMCFGRGRIFEDEARQARDVRGHDSRYFPGRTAGRDYTARALVASSFDSCGRSDD